MEEICRLIACQTTRNLIQTDKRNSLFFGVGGCGGNAVEHMVRQNVSGVTFVATNTDAQVLEHLSVPNKFQFGGAGLGVGGRPAQGRELAEQNGEEIRSLLSGYHMVFITSGMGGGTGTGAAPVIARIAKEMQLLTVAVVTTPFKFEGSKRTKIAKEGIAELSQHVDSIITVPNEKLRQVYNNISIADAFKKADDVLLFAVQGIIETVRCPGQVNVDFEDVCTAMQSRGYAMMGIGRASGDDRAKQATEKATRSPLLDDLRLDNAKGLIVSIKGTQESMNLSEADEIGGLLSKIADLDEGDIFWGFVYDDTMGDELQVTVIATGLTLNESAQPQSSGQQAPAGHASAISQQGSQQSADSSSGPVCRTVQPIHVGDYLKRQQ